MTGSAVSGIDDMTIHLESYTSYLVPQIPQANVQKNAVCACAMYFSGKAMQERPLGFSCGSWPGDAVHHRAERFQICVMR
jgi:hypothetical protein